MVKMDDYVIDEKRLGAIRFIHEIRMDYIVTKIINESL